MAKGIFDRSLLRRDDEEEQKKRQQTMGSQGAPSLALAGTVPAARTQQPVSIFGTMPKTESVKHMTQLGGQQDIDWRRPFQSQHLNDLYKTTVQTLGNVQNVRNKSQLNPLEDAYNIVSSYAETVQRSHGLLGDGKKAAVKLAAGDNAMRDMLEDTINKYKYSGMTTQELREELDKTGYKNRKEQETETRGKVVELARENGWKEEKLDLNSLARQVGEWGGESLNPQQAAMWQQAVRDNPWLSDANLAWLDEDQRARLDAYAQTIGPNDDDLYKSADEYLRSYDELYTTAKDQAQSGRLYAAYGSMADAWGNLKDADGETRYALEKAAEALPWLQDKEGELTDEEKAQLRAYGQSQQAKLDEYREIVGGQQLDRKQQYLLSQYRQTPEGARDWLEDAKGTAEEEEAKRNDWFVERSSHYAEILARDDFDEIAQVNPEYLSSKHYAQVNGMEQANRDNGIYLLPVSGYTANLGDAEAKMTNLEPEEARLYNAIANTEGLAKAEEYLDYMQYTLTERQNAKTAQEFYDLGQQGVGGAVAASVLQLPAAGLRGLGYLDIMGQNLRNTVAEGLGGEYRPVNREGAAQLAGTIEDAAQQGVMDQVDWNVNLGGRDVDVFDQLYGTGMSGVKSLASGAAGNWGGAALLGLGAAQSAMRDAYERGGNDTQAAAVGTLAGIAETLFEHMSLEKFYDEAKHLGTGKVRDKILNVIAQAGINASEEANTEAANLLADWLIMGDKSQVIQGYQERKALGMEDEDNRKRMFADIAWQLGEAAAGGALMGGAFGAISNVTSQHAANKFDKQSGGYFSQENKDRLWRMAEALGGDAQTLAGKVSADKASNKQVGQMWRTVAENLPEQMRSTLTAAAARDIADRLDALPESENKTQIAEAVADMMMGQELEPEQIQLLARDQNAMKMVADIMGVAETQQEAPAAAETQQTAPDAAETQQTAAEAVPEAAAAPGVEQKAPETVTVEAPEAVPEAAAAQGMEQEAPEETKTAPEPYRIKRADGTETKVKGVKRENGVLRLELEDGSSAALEEIDTDEGSKSVLARAAFMEDERAAQDMVKRFRGGDAESGDDYAHGYVKVYDQARKGKNFDAVKSLFADDLSDEQRQAAWEAGNARWQAESAERREKTKAAAKAAGFAVLTDEYRKGRASGLYVAEAAEGLTDKAGNVREDVREQLKIIDQFARRAGLQVRVYDTLETTENAHYETGTNVVNLALDAEQGALVRTASHEGYHYIESFSRDQANTIKKFVLDTLAQKNGYALEDRIAEVMEQYQDGNGQAITREQAESEIVADSMLDVIGNENTMRELFREDRSLAEKIGDWIKNTAQRIRELLKNVSRKSPETQALMDDAEYMDKLSELYAEGIRQARDNYQRSSDGLTAATYQDADVRAYVDAMQSAATAEDAEAELYGLAGRLYARAEKNWISGHMDEAEAGYDRFVEALKTYGRGEMALANALEQQGLEAQPFEMNQALTYAAVRLANDQQITDAEKIEVPQREYSLRTDAEERSQAAAVESVREDSELYAYMRQNKDAAAALRMVEQLHRLTTQGGEDAMIKPGAWEKRLSEIAGKMLEATGSQYSKRRLMADLRKIYSAMDSADYSAGDILEYGKQAMQAMLEAAPGTLVELDDSSKEILRILRTRAFSLSEGQKSEIKGTYGSVSDYTRKNFGKMKIRKEAANVATLEDVWREDLQPLAPGTFAEDTNPADMPGILDAWMEHAREKRFDGSGYGANIGAYATEQALNAMLDYYSMPGALETEQEMRRRLEAAYEERYQRDKLRVGVIKEQSRARVEGAGLNADERIQTMQAHVDRLLEERAAMTERMQYIREAARGKVEAARDKYQWQYQQRIENWKNRREETAKKNSVIAQIRQNVRPIKTKIMNPTDRNHVPEYLRGAAEKLVEVCSNDTALFSGREWAEIADRYRRMAKDGARHNPADAARYDPDAQDMLDWLAQNITKETSLHGKSQEELENISKVVDHIAKLIETTNEIEVNGRRLALDGTVATAIQQLNARKPAKTDTITAKVRGFLLKNLTPVYYGKQVGGIVQEMMGDLIGEAQRKFAFTTRDAKKWYAETIEQDKVNEWIHDPNHLRFTTSAGDEIELNKQQALTLYAWWQREQTNKMQSAEHLRLGGFTYDTNDKAVQQMQGVDIHKSHILSFGDMAKITDYLGEQGKKFADDIITYLSDTVSQWGNETSMSMYGYKKFGEKHYFPYTTDSQFRGQDIGQEGKPQKKRKNMGAAHALTEHARNPLKLGNFTDIFANHINEMALYNAYAEKLDNMERVTNYVVPGTVTVDEEGNETITPPTSIKKTMEKAYGKEAVQYLENFLRDVNGGVRGDERGTTGKLFSAFKKASVAANLSVVLQQPSAFTRAMSMVNPRFFVAALNPQNLKGIKARMYANSGTANIKAMGRFDTNMGKSIEEWINDPISPESKVKRAMDKMDEWTSIGAEKADEITWCYMYAAVENEVAAKTDLERGTDEFNEAVGRRFDEVTTQTQVYDSTLAKSEWMRSTGSLDKMMTSFMGEPTLTGNMLVNAALDVVNKKEGAKKAAAKAAVVFVNSCLVNSLLKSIATALRDKDEGKTYLEKYLGEVVGNFVEDVSPTGILGLFPVARDVISLAEGYNVDRADMSLVEDLTKSISKIVKKGGDATAEEWLNLGFAGANVFGIPARNLWRDISGITGNIFGGRSANRPSQYMEQSMLEGLNVPIFGGYDKSKNAYYGRTVDAMAAGDEERVDYLRGYITGPLSATDKAAESGMKKEVKQRVQDERMEADEAEDLLSRFFGIDPNTAYYTVREWQGGDEYSKYQDWFDGIDGGGKNLQSIVDDYQAHGVTAQTLATQVTNHYKQQFIDLSNSGDTVGAANLKAALLNAYVALGYDRGKKQKDIEKWLGSKSGE